MIFDDEYSENVSLSKILDCLLTDRESPTVIFNFLSKYTDFERNDILLYSSCIPRMFSLDFAYRCSESEYEKLLSFIGDENNFEKDMTDMFMYFLWQILRSDISETRKTKARDILKTISSRFGYYGKAHPYRGILGRKMSEYDSLFISHPDNEDNVILALGRMNNTDFADYMDNIWHSLWGMRMLQLDVFETLEIQKQYIMISRPFQSVRNMREHKWDILRFYSQMMSSNIDVEVKKMLHNIVSSIRIGSDYLMSLPEDVREMITECDCIEEMIMKMQLCGADRYTEYILTYYLLNNDRKSLLWIYENCKYLIEENFDITDLLELWETENNDR